MKTPMVIEHIVNWLNTYAENAGMKGFVIGVSGGIDSAVTSALCAKTGRDVIVLNMPIYQAPNQFALSQKHIQWMEGKFNNVKGYEIDLTPTFKAIENTLPQDIQDGLTMANTRSRLRMITLYSYATHHRMLVAGTGNKVEDFGVGFYTKYGDGGVDVSPIADLMKTEVVEVGRELGVIESILTAPPTDGLWGDDRTDESQLGATYAQLEWAMDYEAGDKTARLTAEQEKVLAIYRRFNKANKHKMLPIPVCEIPQVMKS